MSTSVKEPRAAPRAVRLNRVNGLAAAGLAVVIAIGIGFVVDQGSDRVPTDERSANPRASDSGRVKAEILADAASGADLADSYMRNDPANYSPELKRLLATIEKVNP